MRKIGLVGGTTPESTVDYYRMLIELGRAQQHGDTLKNPVILIYSINLSEMVAHQKSGRRDKVVEILAGVLEILRQAGAEVGALTANTPHTYLEEIKAHTSLPLVSIVEATVAAARDRGCRRVMLLGTMTTMTSEMYPKRFAAEGIEVVIPSEEDREFVDRVIYNELAIGVIDNETKKRYLDLCERHAQRDLIDAVILGCTEIPLLIKEGDISVEIIDTARVHAEAIMQAASE